MRRVVFIIALVSSIVAYSQSDYSIYIPLKTHHFDQTLENIIPSEGGSYGLVFSSQKDNYVYSVGFIENSYGKVSFIGTAGIYGLYQDTEFSLHGGLATNYKDGFYSKQGKESIFGRNGIMPVLLLTIKKDVYKKIGVQINVSPAYVNGGIYYRFKL